LVEITTPEAKIHGRKSQQYTYDAEGNITGVVDGNGNSTRYSLDLWGKVINITEPDGTNINTIMTMREILYPPLTVTETPPVIHTTA